MKPKKFFRSRVCSFGVSVLLVMCGLFIVFTWPSFFKYIMDAKLVLTPQTEIYNSWRDFPDAIPINFYFFNWTNSEDIYNRSVKPKFQQVGPYRFSEIMKNTNLTWNNNGTVTFRHQKIWIFDKESGDMEDKITTINPVALSAAHVSRWWNYLSRKGLSWSFSTIGSTIDTTRTVSEWLFEGYSDPFVRLVNSLPFLARKVVPWDKFGWFHSRNGSVDLEGVFNMGTGENSVLGQVYYWNYWNQTPYNEGTCGEVTGSNGEFFKRNPGKDSISYFSADMCRAANFNYVGEKYVYGILGYKYEINHMLDNGTIDPENQCFCGGECVPSGMLNMSSCKFGSPIFVSLPHFLNADTYYINSVEGVDAPENDDHEFFVTIEPTTGIMLEFQIRVQFNMLLHSVPGVTLYENVNKVFIPLLWFEQNIQIPLKEAFKLKLYLKIPIVCFSTGILLILVGFSLLCYYVYKIWKINDVCGSKGNKYLHQEQNLPLK